MNTLVSHHHISVVCSLRRHHRRRRNSFPQQPPPTTSTDSNNLQLTIDLVSLSPLSLQTRLNKLLTTSTDAYNDLKTLVQIDSNKHMRISCKKSTVTFLIHVLVCGIVVALGFRVLGKLVKLFKSRGSSLREAVVTRRDRSLGGKEVVVGNVSRGRVLESPLESREFTGGMFKGITRNWGKTKGNRLPDWWPKSTSVSVSVGDDNEEYQRQANRLIRAYELNFQQSWIIE